MTTIWTRYVDDNGRVVEVARGLPGWWIVGRHGAFSGSHHRIRTKALPNRRTPEECQRDLDAYAIRKRWLPLMISADRHAKDDPRGTLSQPGPPGGAPKAGDEEGEVGNGRGDPHEKTG